jgi:2-polyprenyl-3-methyl-5-hydroxy-6-metoxy-1,4-benzoquinol methylase
MGPDGLPVPPAGLRIRSAGTANTRLFIEGGRLAEESIRSALARVGAPLDSLKAILDFGCGCGRVLRRWRNLEARVCGSDLSVPAVEWCCINLPFAEVTLNALEPPLPYLEESFELVYALSVLTHLPVPMQLAWLDELARVLRPGGYLLLSIHGDAYADRLIGKERNAYARGECVVRWAEAAGSNLCTTFHPPVFVREHLANGWDLIDYTQRGAIGSLKQDLVVLRRPDSYTPTRIVQVDLPTGSPLESPPSHSAPSSAPRIGDSDVR